MARFYKGKTQENVLMLLGNRLQENEYGGVEELLADTQDAALEKHVPEVSQEGDYVVVRVGSVDHPMIPEHYIEWIYVETKSGGMHYNLSPEDKPGAKFRMAKEEVIAVYAYCNLHGLWKAPEPVFGEEFDPMQIACSPEFGCMDPLED